MFKIHWLIFFLPLCLSVSAQAQLSDNSKRTFYIVRHAEKDTGSNPAISTIGKMRAGDLFRELKSKRIQLILVTEYRRTAMTGDSLRIYKNVDSMHYAADVSGEMLIKKISALPASYKNILIIGHSNTLPGIIRQLGATNYTVAEIPDNEYDNLFVVKRKKGKAILQSKKYGLPSMPSANIIPLKISQ